MMYTKMLYCCMLQSLRSPIQTRIGILEPDNAAALWENIGVKYAVSLAEEHFNIIREITTLYVKDNDRLSYKYHLHDFVTHDIKLTRDRDDFYHNPFINSMRDRQ
ncbi:hypothetical protein I7I50_00749 [Histoplasma capsulatum G186AR]|uniref:Uncharacterized protein n=1 Tax=Ajellomyces capsulatus TaxID=5037 RepID=A0A8H8CW18_AJECA|nr:hypothetical protein I7I52_08017 [Histoplasma capsulatum]QSS72795.1 hypothetical protein I7I50_00749 [Histoplasma capsulatum G186AR]